MKEIDQMDRVAAACVLFCAIVLLTVAGALIWALWAGIGWEAALIALGFIWGLKRLA